VVERGVLVVVERVKKDARERAAAWRVSKDWVGGLG
jgi:hypothetical protein